ncbi:MAG: DUF3501 family protein [Chloroflexi bacterium]|nr:DUF3501 family protein [Chloroflexota bacterium]
MRKLTRADVKDIIQYERIRNDFRARIIALKKARRVEVGPILTFVFENRDTVLFQIEEMMRAERIVQEERIAEELAVYNDLIPGANELSATMLIEITDQRKIKPTLDKMMGIDKGKKVWLQFGDERVYARFEEGHSNEVKISAVHFVRLKFTSQQSRRFRSGEDLAYLYVDHPNYKRRLRLSEAVLKSLRADLDA